MKQILESKHIFPRVLISIAIIIIFLILIVRDFCGIQKSLSANFVIHGLEVQREKVKSKAAMITINHYRPDLTLWKDFILRDAPLDKSFLKDSVRYYDSIVGYAPNNAEGYHLLGLCHYFLGDKKEALAAQKKAVESEPRYFYAWYNLGIMEYEANNFIAATEHFKTALKLHPEAVSKIVGSSRIFIEILRGSGTTQAFNGQRVEASYRDAYRMLTASVNRLRGQPAGIDDAKAMPKVF